MKKQKNRKKIRIVLLIVLPVVFLAGFLFINKFGISNDLQKNSNEGDISDINYNPPTEVEKTETEANKNKVEDRIEIESKNNEPSKTVTPFITFFGQSSNRGAVEVNAYIPGVFEDGGVCTLHMNKQTRNVSRSVNSQKDATTTSCGTITIERDQLDQGEWTFYVNYKSTVNQGDSQTIEIEVE